MNAPFSFLLRWYRAHGRHALPWRRTRNAYAIFISELMLQQTQVERVLDFYARWMKTFPTWESLARAKTDALIRAWAGLGYNRRALYAREAARLVAANGVPRTLEAWRALPGMGPYASAAVFSFTRRIFVPAIDTNVRRVVGRLLLGIPHPTANDDEKIKKILEKNAKKAPWTLTYALMDFGALVCTAKEPRCAACPFARACRTRRKLEAMSAQERRGDATKKRERRHATKPHPDRIYRGRILALVRHERHVRVRDIGPRVDETFDRARDDEWMNAIVARLVREQFLERKNFFVTLSRA